MKPLIYILLAAVLPVSARNIVSLDAGWKFFQGDPDQASGVDFDDSAWRRVDVPHDWSIEGDFSKDAATTGSGGWLPSGVAWYRKEFKLPEDAEPRAWIEFDGVMANSDVWLNGHHLGHRPNGYVSFRYDVSDKLRRDGINELAVRTDTSAQPASRWYSGAGIYRHVRLVTASPVHVKPWGVHVTTPEVSKQKAVVRTVTQVANDSSRSGPVRIVSIVQSADGKTIAKAESTLETVAGKDHEVIHQIPVTQPRLWNLDDPDMHVLVTRITAGDQVLDETETPFGIRNAEFRSDTGFWLNGRNFKIKGVCLHHDGGAVGAAVPLNVWERRLAKLRELGVNAIRTAHNPPAPEFLDLCDRMGFLVMDEFFDCWTKGKNKHDYHRYFKEWSSIDLRDGVLRDRNHPSVILYSVGNEIHDTPHPEIAKPILRRLVDICHEADPSRPVTQALFRPNTSGDYTNGLADMLDVIGTNYRDQELLDAWKAKPGRKIIGTEQGHERSTWLLCRDHPPHSGQFLWVGIDYLGESRSWPLTVFNAGLLDRAGFVMPRGMERQSWWSDRPVVHVLRRIGMTAETPPDPGYEAVEWNRRQVLFPDWNPDDTGPHEESVEVYSNAGEVELFLNDRSLGTKKTRSDAGALNWKVPYEPGTLRAVARTDGNEVATTALRTAGEAETIEIQADRKAIGTGFDDVATFEITLTDAAGTRVPDAVRDLHFEVGGPGRLVAVDSGNIVSTERFQSNTRKTWQGRALAIVRATGPGEIVLTVRSDGLPPATATLISR